MKTKSIIALCGLGLLATQAWADGSAVVIDAQAIANQSGTAAIYRTVRSEMLLAANKPSTYMAPQAYASGESVINTRMRDRRETANKTRFPALQVNEGMKQVELAATGCD